MPNPGLQLAIEIDGDGAHPAAWRRAAHAPDQLLTPQRVRSVATIVENSGFALATVDDDLLPSDHRPQPVGRIGAVERAAFIAASTTTLGIVPTVSTTYTEPFHVSSQLASIDHISVGRAGWLVGESSADAAARAWGRPPVENTRREARDSTRVVRDLWDSWEDDAVIRDVATSRYLDRDRLHYVDFVGETFSVKGPAIVPRPPQGQLVVFAPEGLLPAELVDVALTNGTTRAATPLTFTEIEVALDTAAATATQRIADLGPWPERGRIRYAGPADGLVRLLTDLAGAVDGVRLHPLVLDEDLAVLSRLVVPALLRARVAERPVAGASLRTTLGLARPASRFQETA
jgi:alkanesulfonate monooxygenase SsuD/methylene tetrahydromethanopterin reductase-like flavin-dependent oxidoreductase (luciferase family)